MATTSNSSNNDSNCPKDNIIDGDIGRSMIGKKEKAEDDSEICVICLDELEVDGDDDLLTTPCKHVYHKSCFRIYVESFLVKQATRVLYNRRPNGGFPIMTECPLCRREYNYENLVNGYDDDEALPLPLATSTTTNVANVANNANNTNVATPATFSNVTSPLSIVCLPEYEQLNALNNKEFHCLISVHVKDIDDVQEVQDRIKDHQGIDIVMVLDLSGSMAGSKLDSLKKTVIQFKDNCQANDRLSIVVFNTEGLRMLPLICMSESGKTRVDAAVDLFRASGGTDISAGIGTALSILSCRRVKNASSTILLLTDGHGRLDTGHVEALKAIDKRCSIYTFGYGADHASDLLAKLAIPTGGTHYYIEKDEDIFGAFGHVLGGLTSLFASNIEIKLRCNEKYDVFIASVKSGSLKCREEKVIDENKKEFVDHIISVPNILFGERKQFLVKCHIGLSSLGQSNPTTPLALIKGTCTFEKLSRNTVKKEEIAAFMNVSYDPNNSSLNSQQQNLRVKFEMFNNKVKESLERCNEMILRRNLEQARNLIDEILALDTSYYNDIEFPECKALVRQTEQLREVIRDGTLIQSQQQQLQQQVHSMSVSMNAQRSNNTSSASEYLSTLSQQRVQVQFESLRTPFKS